MRKPIGFSRVKKGAKAVILALGTMLSVTATQAADYIDFNADAYASYVDKIAIPKTESILLEKGRKLSTVVSVKGDLFLGHSNRAVGKWYPCTGPLEAGTDKPGVHYYTYTKTDTEEYAVCQFQGKEAGYTYLMVVDVKFTQVGNDIYAQVIKTHYPYNDPYGKDQSGTAASGTYEPDLATWYDKVTTKKGGVIMSLHNVELEFAAEGLTSTVTFLDRDGQTILSTQVVPYGEAATPPSNDKVTPVDGYVVAGWDGDYTVIQRDTVFKPVYHKLCAVKFVDGYGDMIGEEQTVEETKPATPPDMTGRLYDGAPFYAWDGDPSVILDDTTFKAIYKRVPAWTTGSYDPATWAATNNILSKATISKDGIAYYTEGTRTTKDLTLLTNGVVPPRKGDFTGIVGVKSGSIEWTLDDIYYIDCLNIYTIWEGGGRDGIAIDQILYQTEATGDEWIEAAGPIDGNTVSYGLNNDSSFGALFATLANADGFPFMEGATALKIVFAAKQDHDGAGYVEIEATGMNQAELDGGAIVTFVDYDGKELQKGWVNYGTAAVPPEDPTREGYKFIGWEGDYSYVDRAMTITAKYHKWCNVVFKNADGTQIGATQIVEETFAAQPPSMINATYEGKTFLSWDGDPSVITDDIIFTALYGGLPAYVQPFLEEHGSELPAGSLIWAGGTADTWNTDDICWVNADGLPTRWVDGAVAVLPVAAEIALDGEQTVSEILVYGDVVLTGDAITLAAPATVVYNANASLRIENDVKGTDGLTTRIREKHDVFVPAQWYRSVFAEDEDICSQKEETVFFENVKLEDVTAIGGLLEVKYGNAAAVKYEIDSDNPQKDAGVFYYQNNGTTLTAQFQGKSYSSYDGVYHCVKVELTQDGENVKGKIAYVRSATCTYGGQDASTSRWGKGWKLGDNCDESVCANNAYNTWFYDFVIGSASYTIYDELPTEMATTFTGDYGISGGLTINNGTVTIDGTYAVKQPVAIAPGSLLVFGPNADVELTNDGTGDGTNVFNADGNKYTGEVDIYGTVRVYKTGSYGPYNMFGHRTALNVRDGGELVLDTSTYSQYGFSGVKINCYEGGIIRLTAERTLGVNNNRVFLYGGTLTNECVEAKDQYLIDATLADGAVVSGSRYLFGFYDVYVGTSGDITMIAATGTKPSYINAETLTFGNKNGKPTSTSNDEIAEFNIEDVTGDAESDLIINSQIVKNGTPVLTVADGATADNRLFHAIVKKGAGTLELNNAIDMVGAVKMQEGTLRLGAKASGTLGALVVTGNSTLDIAEGATMAFDDSTALAWTEGATLNLTGDISGLTFAGLSDAQLAAITINGKASKLRLTSDGRLLKPGFQLIIR